MKEVGKDMPNIFLQSKADPGFEEPGFYIIWGNNPLGNKIIKLQCFRKKKPSKLNFPYIFLRTSP